MSFERAIHVIDSLLEVLDEADKREQGGKTCDKPCAEPCNATKKTEPVTTSLELFQSLDGIEESQLIQITSNLELLQSKWKEAGLAENDELPAFRNQIGKVVEIESSDDTLQIQWENYDTCWVPAFACGQAPSGSKLTIPGTNNSWLNDSKKTGEEYEEELKNDGEDITVQEMDEGEHLLANVEDTAVIKGNTLRVTKFLKILQQKWESSQSEKHDDVSIFLGAVGTIKSISEDYDIVELEWKNNETSMIPVQACMDANGVEPTLPHKTQT